MANRRMFSKNIVRTDKFLDMPQSSRLLYYDLGVDADDDGFVSPKMIMRLTGSSDDDLKMLIAKGFVYQFEDGVIVILDWKVNNEIRQDRYNQTQYLDHKNRLTLEDGRYSMVLPMVLPAVGHRLGKVRLGQVSIGNIKKTDSLSSLQEVSPTVISAEKFDRKWLEGFIERHDEKEAEEIAKQFKGLISTTEVFLKAEEIPDYCERKNRWKKYSNFRTVLTSWLRKDYKAKVLELERVKEEMKQQGYATAEELFNL
jgi:hypothetical protein